jgi:putative hemolysin
MKWIVLCCATLVAGCANSPPADNRSAPGAGQPAVDERREARALEQAEANCASQGKHAEAKRVEGITVYDCVTR